MENDAAQEPWGTLHGANQHAQTRCRAMGLLLWSNALAHPPSVTLALFTPRLD